jgi:hypothetical protein
MKKIVLIIFALFSAYQLVAQSDSTSTTISSKPEKYQNTSIFGSSQFVGGFGALSTKVTQVDNEHIMMMGLKGAVVFGHNFNLGLAGYGFLNTSSLNSVDSIEYGGGYGGLYLEPVLWSKQPVHLAFPMIVGAGGVSTGLYGGKSNSNDYDWSNENSSAFFVFEPGVVVEFNIIENVRFDIGGTYRFTYGLDLPDVSSNVLDAWAIDFTLKVGVF